MHPQEVVKLIKILHGELPLQCCCDNALPELHRGCGEDDIIHVEKKIRRVRSVTEDEQAGVGLGLHKTKCQQEGGKAAVPGSRGLLQAVQRLVQTADEGWVSRVLKPSGLRAVDSFYESPV
jgi:hypothetical protein